MYAFILYHTVFAWFDAINSRLLERRLFWHELHLRLYILTGFGHTFDRFFWHVYGLKIQPNGMRI